MPGVVLLCLKACRTLDTQTLQIHSGSMVCTVSCRMLIINSISRLYVSAGLDGQGCWLLGSHLRERQESWLIGKDICHADNCVLLGSCLHLCSFRRVHIYVYIHTCVLCIHIYIYMYIHLSLSLPLSPSLSLKQERERERERDVERELLKTFFRWRAKRSLLGLSLYINPEGPRPQVMSTAQNILTISLHRTPESSS